MRPWASDPRFVHHVRTVLDAAIAKDPIAAARIIAPVVIERADLVRQRQTVMTPKLKGLADKLRSVTASVEARANALADRLDKVDGSSAANTARINAELDAIDAAVHQVEDLVNQMSNGGPPLAPSP